MFFQRLLVLISRARFSGMFCKPSLSTYIPFNHADNVGAVLTWAYRSICLVARSIFLVLFDIYGSSLNQIQYLLSLSDHKPLRLDLVAYPLGLARPRAHYCNDIDLARWHTCSRGSRRR
jgi:hypothetical protein